MNTKSKTILAIGIIGAVLLCFGFVMGSGFSSIAAMFSGSQLPSDATEISDCKKSDIRALEVNLFDSKITIKKGKDFEVTGSGVFNNYVENGTYYVGASSVKRSVNVLGMNLSVPSKWVCGYGSYVITIPEKNSLEKITIHTNRSSITGDTLKAADIDLLIKHGNLDMNLISADNLTLSVPNGKINTQNTLITNSGTIDAKKEVSIGNNTTVTNTLNNVSITTKKGNISFTGQPSGTCECTTDKGDINTTLAGGTANYKLTPLWGQMSVDSNSDSTSSSDFFGNVNFSAKKGNIQVHFK